MKVGGRHDNAVGGELVARLELDDVAHNEFPDGDGLHLATLTTKDWERFFAAQVLELHEFVVLVRVVPRSD